MTKESKNSLKNFLQNPEVIRLTGEMNDTLSDRLSFKPRVCSPFKAPVTRLLGEDKYLFEIDPEAARQLKRIVKNRVEKIVPVKSPDADMEKKYKKKRRIGIVFSGGPAPGGHNVIAGLFDIAKRTNPENEIYGFILGPDGILENQAVRITKEMVDAHRNLGGFSMIKTGRTKIDTRQKMELSKERLKSLRLDALVIVGGDDSNTNAAFLAEELFDEGIQVIGVPKTIDGDIQVRDSAGRTLCAMSFGFHSAALAFARDIANLCTDCSSDVKYWHVCKVMGRVASHLALEVALQTHANMTLIGEDLSEYVDNERLKKAEKNGVIDYTAYGMTLRHLSRVICDAIVRRAAVGKNYGVIVIPEGVLEFINEIQTFIIKLNTIIAEYNSTHDTDFHDDFPTLDEKLDYLRRLARKAREEGRFSIWNTRDDDLFNDIPAFFQEGLLTERDSHGNFQFSLVETDKVLMGLVKDYLDMLKERGEYKIGIHHDYFKNTLKEAGLDPEAYGPVLFRNYGEAYLLVSSSIISLKTLKQVLVRAGLLSEDEDLPEAVLKIYKKSEPKFKTQGHFYGYDGRGTDPTIFDANYTYNLGMAVFSLIANGATGQMAAIRNLEYGFDRWEPVGIPIACLMRMEERKGRLALVIEKSIVDINSPAFLAAKANREKWLAANPGPDCFRRPDTVDLFCGERDDMPITLALNALGRVETAG